MFRIREAGQGDIPAIMTVWEEAVRATHGFLSGGEIEYYKGRMPQYMEAVRLYVCESGGKIKGFSGIAGGKLEMLFVSERGAGIGSALLRQATGNGVTKVDVNEENQPALSFYEANGFRREGRSATDGEGRPHPILHLSAICPNTKTGGATCDRG